MESTTTPSPSLSTALSTARPHPQLPAADVGADARFETRKVTLVPTSTPVIDETTQARSTGIKEGQQLSVLRYATAPGQYRYTAITPLQLDRKNLPRWQKYGCEMVWSEQDIQQLTHLENWQEYDEAEVQEKMRRNSASAVAQQQTHEQRLSTSARHTLFAVKLSQFIEHGQLDPLSETPTIKTYQGSGLFRSGTVSVCGGQQHQQDNDWAAVINLGKTLGQPNYQYFCLCDGHGKRGQTCSESVARQLIRDVYKQMKANHKLMVPDVATHTALKSAFVSMRHSLITDGAGYHNGTTACMILIQDGMVTAANAGDSRALVIDNQGTTTQLTEDARSHNPRFLPSIHKRHGVVVRNPDDANSPLRLGQRLIPVRGLGDGNVTGISARPKITRLAMANGGEGYTIVIATDGIFELATSDQIGKLVHHQRLRENSPKEIASNIVSLCLTTAQTMARDNASPLKTYADNMTAMVIFPDQFSQS